MTIRTTNVTVTTTATPLIAVADTDGDPASGVSVLVVSGSVWVGGSNVTADAAAATGGRPLVTGGTFDFDLANPTDVPFAITASGSAVVHVFRTGA